MKADINKLFCFQLFCRKLSTEVISNFKTIPQLLLPCFLGIILLTHKVNKFV